jgi:hypothetical protein
MINGSASSTRPRQRAMHRSHSRLSDALAQVALGSPRRQPRRLIQSPSHQASVISHDEILPCPQSQAICVSETPDNSGLAGATQDTHCFRPMSHARAPVEDHVPPGRCHFRTARPVGPPPIGPARSPPLETTVCNPLLGSMRTTPFTRSITKILPLASTATPK